MGKRYDAMRAADHIRSYEQRIDIINRALEILDDELAGMTDENGIVQQLTHRIADYVALKYPRPVMCCPLEAPAQRRLN